MSDYRQEVIKPGDAVSKLAKDVNVASFANNRAVHLIPQEQGNFRSPVSFIWRRDLQKMMSDFHLDSEGMVDRWNLAQSVENDGAGGKPQFFTLVGTEDVFGGLGWEVIEMAVEDFVRSGRYPAVIDNEINFKSITKQNYHLCQAMLRGYGRALKATRVINITGETAVMKNSITAFCDIGSNEQLILTWGASCIGLTCRRLLIDGSRIRPGQAVVGFWEPGYRCNGGGFFTELIQHKWGPRPEDILQSDEARRFAEGLTIPSQNYSRILTPLVGWGEDGTPREPLVEIYGIAHITGGGLWGKFGEILPDRVGAVLNKMPDPAPVLLEGFELSQSIPNLPANKRLTEWTAYETLHGGCGMILVCNPRHADRIIQAAAARGVKAQVIGETMEFDRSEIFLNSRFGKQSTLSSLNPDRPE